MTNFFTNKYFLPAKLSINEYFLLTNSFSRRIFLTRRFQITLFIFCLKVNALDVKFRFLPYFMTENPTETERNVIISSFFGVLLCFYHVSTINFSKSLTLFQYLMDKKIVGKKYSSAKSNKIFSKWQKFLPTNIFCWRNFPPMKFLPIRYQKSNTAGKNFWKSEKLYWLFKLNLIVLFFFRML